MISIDAHEVIDLSTAWRKAPELVARELTAAVTEAQLLLTREVKESTPAAATGSLRSSIHADDPIRLADSILGVVGTSSAHALPVELGTKPHFPPIKPLIDWVKATGYFSVKNDAHAAGIAMAIARKISWHGTKGKFMFRNTFVANTHQIQTIFKVAQVKIGEQLTNE